MQIWFLRGVGRSTSASRSTSGGP